MDRQRQKGFTLTELLIVILIIAILIALLMPALASAWYTAYTTECKTHLATIYQASVTFANDDSNKRNAQHMFPFGDSWVCMLLPYVEGKMTVFTCPAALPPKTPADAGTSSSGDSGSSTGGTPWNAADPPPNTPYCKFAFDIYMDKAETSFWWTVSVDSPWSRSIRTGTNTWNYSIEDQGYQVEQGGTSDLDYNDIVCEVTYKDGFPTQVKILSTSQGAEDDLTVNGIVVIKAVGTHIGAVVSLKGSDDANRVTGGNGATTFYYPWPNGYDPTKPSNYGLNKGTYDVANLNITKPDANLIFILDHGCDAPLVDAFDGNFDKYFIQDPAVWNTLAWAKDGADWREYQSLRHFSKANVLFCDGHIESLGHDDLDPLFSKNWSLWRSSGN